MNLPVNSIDLSQYRPEDLIRLRTRIEDFLGLDLDTMDLNQELLIQFKMTRIMLQDVQADEEAALNHKTGLINSCSALLKQIAEAQVTLYNASRAQRVEAALISTLKSYPDMEATFRKELRERLGG